MMKPYFCYFCAVAKNSSIHLDQFLINVETIGSLFVQYKVLFFYEESSDDTLAKLLAYQYKNSDKVHVHTNRENQLKYRTWNLARARNFCLNFVRANEPNCPFFVMMDINSVTAKTVQPLVLKKYLSNDDRWDALSFQTKPTYYDVWGLSIFPFSFSIYHFKNAEENTIILREYETDLLNKLEKNQLLPCLSAFNGFSIYKLKAFDHCEYNGKLDLSKIPNEYILSHKSKANSDLVFEEKKFFSGKNEDCEHRHFHFQGHLKNGARIMISPQPLFIDYESYLSLFD